MNLIEIVDFVGTNDFPTTCGFALILWIKMGHACPDHGDNKLDMYILEVKQTMDGTLLPLITSRDNFKSWMRITCATPAPLVMSIENQHCCGADARGYAWQCFNYDFFDGSVISQWVCSLNYIIFGIERAYSNICQEQKM